MTIVEKRMNFKRIVLSFFIVSTFTSVTQATEVIAADSSKFTKLCMVALNGNRAALHSNIKASGYSQDYIVSNLRCNGDNILTFVEQYGKNTDSMLRILNRGERSISITDIAKVNN